MQLWCAGAAFDEKLKFNWTPVSHVQHAPPTAVTPPARLSLECAALEIRRAGHSFEAHKRMQSKGSAISRTHQGNASTPEEYFLKGSPPGAPLQGSEMITPQISRYYLLVAAHRCPSLSCAVHKQPAGVFFWCPFFPPKKKSSTILPSLGWQLS